MAEEQKKIKNILFFLRNFFINFMIFIFWGTLLPGKAYSMEIMGLNDLPSIRYFLSL
jgi:hypothetical protein